MRRGGGPVRLRRPLTRETEHARGDCHRSRRLRPEGGYPKPAPRAPGTRSSISARTLDSADDYPDFVVPLARAVAAGTVERGVAVCGSGVGASVCANKVQGVRACMIEDHFSARQGVEDDHMNVLCLGGRVVGPEVAWDLVETFLAAQFSQAERHLRRLGKVAALEGRKGA